MTTERPRSIKAAGIAAWRVATLVRAEVDAGSSPDTVVFLAEVTALHIEAFHNGDAQDCNLCIQATWKAHDARALVRR